MGLLKGRDCMVILVSTLLVLCVTVSLAKEDPELRQCKHQCRHQRQFDSEQVVHCERECESYIKQKERYPKETEEGEKPRWQEEREQRGIGDIHRTEEVEEEIESGHPYVFQDKHFRTKIKTQEGRMRVLQKFNERSELLKGIENFRVVICEANPQTFVLPNHWDADSIFFVARGKATLNLVYTDRRESYNIELGHVMVIPAGVTAYLINRGNQEKLILAMLVNPVANPGKFVPFFGPGGENPESYISVFSSDLLEAAFKTPKDRLQKIFSQQREGVIVRASKEQIKALTHEEGTHWPFAGKGSRDTGPVHLLSQRPRESNKFGKLFEIDLSDNRQLQELGISVSFANFTQGSMHTPLYNSRATKVAVVTKGRGYFEMACPHVSAGTTRRDPEGPIHYKKISSELTPGTVFVVPAGHPFITMASEDENLEVVCFQINAENNHKFPLAGKKNIMRNFEREAKKLAFAAPADEVDRLLENQEEEFFLQGPRHQRRHGIASY